MPSIELSRLQLQAKHLSLLSALLTQYVPAAQVWAYGSRVSDGSHECSNLDILLRNPAGLTTGCTNLHALRDALSASRLPILVDVHDWAHLPDSFHRNIEQAYIELQAGTSHCSAVEQAAG